jgi:hypothetical protein
MAAVPIRDDLKPAELRALARRERDGRVSARLLALANALEGQGSRMKGCDHMRGPTLKKPLPAKPRFFRSTPERAEPISA